MMPQTKRIPSPPMAVKDAPSSAGGFSRSTRILLLAAAALGVGWIITANNLALHVEGALQRQHESRHLLRAADMAASAYSGINEDYDDPVEIEPATRRSLAAESSAIEPIQTVNVDYVRIEQAIAASRDAVLHSVARHLAEEKNGKASAAQSEPERDERKKLAILITGESSMLEIESKLRHVVQPQLDNNWNVEVLFFLDAFGPLPEEDKPRYPSPYSVTSWNSEELRAWTRRVFRVPPEDAIEVNAMRRAKVNGGELNRKEITALAATESGARFPVRCILRYNESDPIAPTTVTAPMTAPPRGKRKSQNARNLEKGVLFRGWDKTELARARRMRRAMIEIEALEAARASFFDVIMHIDERSLVFAPLVIPPHMGHHDFATNACLFAEDNGINPHEFAVGRAKASAVLRGLAEAVYFDVTKPMSAAKLFAEVVRETEASVFRMHECSWAVLPVVFGENANEALEITWDEGAQHGARTCAAALNPVQDAKCPWLESELQTLLYRNLRLDLIQRDTVGPYSRAAIESIGLPWPETEAAKHQPLSRRYSPFQDAPRIIMQNKRAKIELGRVW
ncbi:Hypothetical Protein FCC1311_072862 [Hondaea fermentalgiana]|uniref:Uncharacterized protein n=1 Tax=Hondaea fermentalgiana TaxID=2315210 RepID=A0A2R5GKB7_9STRA|nr:Hypothetical Protein FCC1311_072862 [Hondaea fermentalgiana]|eukprot:GBG31065.1 Hypothetical Protein FCC1311_072862 [Hondaea fermentalgiana]